MRDNFDISKLTIVGKRIPAEVTPHHKIELMKPIYPTPTLNIKEKKPKTGKGFLYTAFGITIVAVLGIIANLTDSSTKQMNDTITSVVTILVIALIFAIIGYNRYRKYVKSNFKSNQL